MKYKTIFIFFIIAFVIFIIYIFNIDKKIYYINITDSNIKYNIAIKNELINKKKLEKYIMNIWKMLRSQRQRLKR